ncbi:MAG: molybdopterin-dependent oxidoreductase, partial [Burkholderiales bacterium]
MSEGGFRQFASLRRAPENFLGAVDISAVRAGRRDFLRDSLLAAGTAMGVAAVSGAARAASTPLGNPALGNQALGDPAILNLPKHATTLGQPVAALGYGRPSQYEKNLERRQSPGLTRVAEASVAFTPLQGLFGIITPSGLHFERHHQGWHDIDPNQHRLMINGLVREARVYTMDDLLRLPSVSRMHFIECGARS